MKNALFCHRSFVRCSFLPVLLLFALFYAESSPAQQQGTPSDGKDFYLGFVLPSFNKNPGLQGRDFHGFFGVYALISSYESDNLVKVSYFDGSGREIQSKSVILQARSAIQVALDKASMQMTEPGDIPEYRACHITSKKPVNVQYFSTGANSGGSYLALPTTGLGKNYVIASYNDNPGAGAVLPTLAENAGGYFLIIAPFDGTNVTITPNGLTAGGHKGVHTGSGANGTQHPYTVLLMRGQCYWVKGEGSDPLNDLSGSIVVSDKPIAVLAGHEDAFLGGVNGKTLDARNFMIQQMIPAEYFDSTGYVSMPLKDPAGADVSDAGFGENYHVFAFDTNNVGVQAKQAGVVNSNAMTTTALWSPPREIANVSTSTEFHSLEFGRKFSVIMYDLRDFGNGGSPQACASMMSIVPMSRWRTSFLFYVPANTFEVLQNYYINVIAEKGDIDKGNIKFTFNGSTLKPLTALTNLGKSYDFPYHPELEGARYSVSPGAYYLTNTRTMIDPLVPIDTMLQGSFMVYHYGMRGIDPDHDIGDFDGDDSYFEYATPVGMMLSAGGGSPKAKVDTLCTSWHICATDTGSITIRSVTLLDDPDGNYYRPGKKFHNIHFDPALDPDNNTEINFSGDNKSQCFDVIVTNPLDTAYAPLYIVDSRGTHTVIDLRYQPPQMQVSKLPDLPKRLDTLKFPTLKIGDHICDTLLYINTAAKGGKAYGVSAVSLKKNDPHFTIGWISPALPANMQGGDTLKVQVCFDPKQDTLAHDDSVILTTDCFKAPLPIVGKGSTPLIYATDWDFGNVTVGTTVCHDISIQNHGNLPFVLTKNWLLHYTTTFSMSPASAARLPLTITPGGFATLTFCYSPTQLDGLDSANVDWNTDIAPPFTDQLKSWSHLQGRPVKPGVVWDRQRAFFVPDSTIGVDSTVTRVYLVNNSSRLTHVTIVSIIGPTASEFSMLRNQLGYYPLQNFDMDTGSKIWIDVVFKPDLTKPYPDRFADRIDTLEASYENEKLTDDQTFVTLIGTWNKNDVKSSDEPSFFIMRPNPVIGKSLTLSFTLPVDNKVSFSLFDVLGREVYRNPALAKTMLSAGVHESEITLPNIESGIYYGRLTTGNFVATQKLEIVK